MFEQGTQQTQPSQEWKKNGMVDNIYIYIYIVLVLQQNQCLNIKKNAVQQRIIYTMFELYNMILEKQKKFEHINDT